MKKTAYVLMWVVASLLCLWGSTKAALVGKFDLSPTVSPVVARNYSDGYWMAGAEHQLWSLSDSVNSKILFYVSPQYLHGISGNNQSASLVIGAPIGDAGSLLGLAINQFDNNSFDAPKWAQQLGNIFTIELGGGYNFLPQFSYIKPWFATVGAVVKIPIGQRASL